jgi:hypothetical protein
VLVGACADPTDDDSDREAELAPEQPLGKDDAASFTGVYAASATTKLRNGDIPNLELNAAGDYVRRRCYHTDCALPVAETDHFDTYTSSSGKTYVRFYAFRTEWNEAAGDRDEIRVVGDVYEIVRTTTTIKLRKAYSSRWLSLRKTTARTLCTGDGGTWTDGACACPGAGDWSDDGYVGFVAGAGGCTTIAGAGEGECDDTGGWYTDDDSTAVGTYCRCDKGSYLANTGCEAI